jgi:hypothetical protein
VTVAVNVTDCPGSEGSAEEVIAIEVGSGFTCSVTAGEPVDPSKFVSPEYIAVTVWVEGDVLVYV